ncbi:hypothetical protein [Streptomyces sp. Tue6028]|uniref:hypothetical protein n=1 Tax=Streptomyces sp. Tue6028 TaxID=2036037 RepID=UPI003D71E21E
MSTPKRPTHVVRTGNEQKEGAGAAWALREGRVFVDGDKVGSRDAVSRPMAPEASVPVVT